MKLPRPRSIPYKWARRIAVGIVGGTVVLLGVAMLVLPGPGVVVILVGLGILGIEFAFARRWLAKLREQGGRVIERVKSRRGPPDPPAA